MMLGVAAIPFYTLGVFSGLVIDSTGWSMRQYQTAFTFIIAGTLFGPVLGKRKSLGLDAPTVDRVQHVVCKFS